MTQRVKLTYYGGQRGEQDAQVTGKTERLPLVGEAFKMTSDSGDLVTTYPVANAERIGKEWRFQSEQRHRYGLEVLDPA